jgi:hypothetical protein
LGIVRSALGAHNVYTFSLPCKKAKPYSASCGFIEAAARVLRLEPRALRRAAFRNREIRRPRLRGCLRSFPDTAAKMISGTLISQAGSSAWNPGEEFASQIR